MCREVQGGDDPSCEGSAFEDLVLGLIVIQVHGVDGKDLLEIDNLGILFVDLDRGRTPVDRPHRISRYGSGDDNNEEKGDDGPSPFPDDLPVIP